MRAVLAVALISVGLSGCAGYRIGDVRPNHLSDIHSIAVPTFKNKTLVPRIEILLTNSVIKQIQQDGSYRVATDNNADATLEAEIVRVWRSPARSVRGNVLATTEFHLNMRVRYKLVSTTTSITLAEAETQGSTNFFVGNDLNADERQAMPLAAEDLATRLVSQISEGW